MILKAPEKNEGKEIAFDAWLSRLVLIHSSVFLFCSFKVLKSMLFG